MNVDRLRDSEALFMLRYPGGFAGEEMQARVRRHNVGRLVEFAQTALAPERFAYPGQVLDDVVRIVSRSSMVSMFEKPRFRDFVQGADRDRRAWIAGAIEQLLHGDEARGFAELVELLGEAGLAKWSLVTICLFYLRPEHEVFVKPTTTKNVIRQYEIEGLVYRPRPDWAFYARYREVIGQMKALVDPSLSPNNAAFTGFLMMSSAVGQPDGLLP